MRYLDRVSERSTERQYYLCVHSPMIMNSDNPLSFRKLKCAVRLSNKCILRRIGQCCAPSNPCNCAVVVHPGKASLDNGVRRPTIIIDDFAHENSEFTNTSLSARRLNPRRHGE